MRINKNEFKGIGRIILSLFFCIYVTFGFAQEKESNTSIKHTKDTIYAKYYKCKGKFAKCMIFNNKTVLDTFIIFKDKKEFEKIRPEGFHFNFKRNAFNKYIYIYIVASIGGCNQPEIEERVYMILSSKKYIVQLNIRQDGICSPIFIKCEWIKIKRPDNNYTLEYKENRLPIKNLIKFKQEKDKH